MQNALQHDTVPIALGEDVRGGMPALVDTWNWKAAAVSALVRGSIFLTTNLQDGPASAMRAMLVELVFAVLASGMLGAITQRLRRARPAWLTALVIWMVLPALMLELEFSVHRAFGTPHLRTGLIASFCIASVSSGFTWYAMRRGLLLAGPGAAGVAEDLRRLPRVVLDFALAPVRLVLPRQ